MKISYKHIIRDLFAVATNQDLNKRKKSNIFFDIGYEEGKARLGWVVPPTWPNIQIQLERFALTYNPCNVENVIFCGMGGSINTIKALIGAFGNGEKTKIFTIDSLDPKALRELIGKISNLSKTLVIGISKSGTTKEPLLIMDSIRYYFEEHDLNIKKHFVWLADLANQKKIEDYGWTGVNFFPIQVDNKTDIGGRFAAPHTMVFLLPVYLLANSSLQIVEDIWKSYLSTIDDSFYLKVIDEVRKIQVKKTEYVAVAVSKGLAKPLATWMTQLFQESLGSKMEIWFYKIFKSSNDTKLTGNNPKTLIIDQDDDCPDYFEKIDLTGIQHENRLVNMMQQMYMAQLIVAIIAHQKRINFVTQPEVETYKQKMREVSKEKIDLPDRKKLEEIVIMTIDSIKGKNNIKFIEIICYWDLTCEETKKIKDVFEKEINNKMVFVFVGSDWNHHSYQSAGKDPNTFHIIAIRSQHEEKVEEIKEEIIKNNVDTLKTIAYCSYLTLEHKAMIWHVDSI